MKFIMRFIKITAFILLTINTFFIQSSLGIKWPIMPFDEGHVIGVDYGGWTLPHQGLHTGIDIPVDSLTRVYAINNGIVTAYQPPVKDRSGKWIQAGYIIIADNATEPYGWYYGHLVECPSKIGLDSTINILDTLGSVSPVCYLPSNSLFDYHHLHLQRSECIWGNGHYNGYANPLEYLTPQPTQSVHIKQDSIFFLPDGENNLDKQFKPNASGVVTINGKVDIAVRAFTDIQGGWSGKYAGVYKIGYEIVGPDPSTNTDDVPLRVLAEFTGQMKYGPSTEYDLIYLKYPPSEGWFRNTYIVTNCGDSPDPGGLGNVQENCWDTEKVPNGIYRVIIKAWTYGVTEPAEVSVDVKVSNFHIYISSNNLESGDSRLYNSNGDFLKTLPVDGSIMAVDDYENIYTSARLAPYEYGVKKYDNNCNLLGIYPTLAYPVDIAVVRDRIWYRTYIPGNIIFSTDGGKIKVSSVTYTGLEQGLDGQLFIAGRCSVYIYDVTDQPFLVDHCALPEYSYSYCGIAFDGVNTVYCGGSLYSMEYEMYSINTVTDKVCRYLFENSEKGVWNMQVAPYDTLYVLGLGNNNNEVVDKFYIGDSCEYVG